VRPFVLDGDGSRHPAGRRRSRANESNNTVDGVAEISYGYLNTCVEIAGQAVGPWWIADSAHAVDRIRSTLRVFRVVQLPSKYPAHHQGKSALQKKVVAVNDLGVGLPASDDKPMRSGGPWLAK
jgi:hypothetical protein